MKNIIHIVIMLIAFINTINSSNAQSIIKEKSKVEFEIGNLGIGSVDGIFQGMDGSIQFDKSNLKSSSFHVCIDASTINTENKKRDEHLRNEDFFHVDKYPTICFTSTSIHKHGEDYITKGKLTILKISKDIEIPFSIHEEDKYITFAGTIKVNRFDYKLGTEAYSGTFMVGDVAELKITCAAKK